MPRESTKSVRDTAEVEGASILPMVRRGERDGGPDGSADAQRAVVWLPAGARVLTRQGERPVEVLSAGMLVMSLGPGASWREVTGVRAAAAPPMAGPDAAPVLIRREALMKGAPIRDTAVAPSAMLVLDGVTVPVAALVNGRSILREAAGPVGLYHAVYLAEPGQLIVDGALVEVGGGEGGALRRLAEGPELDALRARIVEQAETLPLP